MAIANGEEPKNFSECRFFFHEKKTTYGSFVTKPFYLNTSFTYESFFGYILMNNEGKITK